MKRKYRLKNGYSITTISCYDGYREVYRWGVFTPDGTLYRSCDGWNRAYEIASKGADKEWRVEYDG